MKVSLGDKVKDPITGISGIAYSYITYLHGCERVGIQQPKVKNENGQWDVPELFYVDDPQLEIIKQSQNKKIDDPNGGPSGFDTSHKPRI